MPVVTAGAAVIGSFEGVARAAGFTDSEHNVLLLTNTMACEAMIASNMQSLVSISRAALWRAQMQSRHSYMLAGTGAALSLSMSLVYAFIQ